MDDYIWSIIALLPALIVVVVALACKRTKVTTIKPSWVADINDDRGHGLRD